MNISYLTALTTPPLALVSGETASGTYGAGADTPWCMVIHQGNYYAKVTSVSRDAVITTGQPSCVGGR